MPHARAGSAGGDRVTDGSGLGGPCGTPLALYPLPVAVQLPVRDLGARRGRPLGSHPYNSVVIGTGTGGGRRLAGPHLRSKSPSTQLANV